MGEEEEEVVVVVVVAVVVQVEAEVLQVQLGGAESWTGAYANDAATSFLLADCLWISTSR